MRNSIRLVTIVFTGLIIFVCGCSKSGDVDKGKVNNSDNRSAAIAALPNADPNTPLNQYTKLTSGNQLMFVYYALLNMPIDYDRIASAYSQDYSATTDAFKKKDILNALKPIIDVEISKGKETRYLQAEFNPNIGHYDFNIKGFPVNTMLDINSYAFFSDKPIYKYSFTNGESFKILKVADEAKAREIESMINRTYQPGKLVLYFFTQRAIPNDLRIECQIVKLRLLDHQGNELLVQ